MLGRLGRYVLRDFAGLFGMAFLLVTFAMCLGAIYKAIDVLSRGLMWNGRDVFLE